MTDNIKKRGFGSLSTERKAEISSKGGKKAHELKVAHRFSPKEASDASKKGWKERRSREDAK